MYEKEIQRSKITPSRQKQSNGKIFERYRTIIPRGIVRDFGFETKDCIILKQINDTIQIKFAKNNDLNFIKIFKKNTWPSIYLSKKVLKVLNLNAGDYIIWEIKKNNLFIRKDNENEKDYRDK